MPITHSFVSTNTDTQDATFVRKAEWNADHVIDGLSISAATSYLGYNTIGASTETSTAFRWYLKRVTAATDGIIENVAAYLVNTADGSTPGIMAGVWSESSSLPNQVLAVNGPIVLLNPDNVDDASAGQARWFSLPIGLHVTAGNYWIGFGFSAATGVLYYDDTGTDDKYFTQGSGPFPEDAGFRTLNTATDKHYSIRALFVSVDTLAGMLLGYVANTAGDQSITSATMADLPTNIAVTFTAPASGNVLVRLAATAGATTTSNAYQSWGLRESTSNIAGAVGDSVAVRHMTSASEGLIGAVKEFVITGLTPGNSYTYKWSAACSTSGGTFKANSNSPAVMTVWAL